MTDSNQDENAYITRDLWLAATLRTLSFELIKIDYQIEGSQTVGYFNFKNSDRLQKAENRYYNNEIAVDPRELESHLKSLKSRVHNMHDAP